MTAVLPSSPSGSRAAEAGPASGLTSSEARERLERAGPNVLAEAERPHWLACFARNFTHLFALLLWVGAVLAWLGDQPPLSVAIVVVIVVSAGFSFAQEYRAERAVEALRRILPQRARVRRDGQPHEIAAREVVPGDVLLLSAGDRMSADGELVADVELKVDIGHADRRIPPGPQAPDGGARGRQARHAEPGLRRFQCSMKVRPVRADGPGTVSGGRGDAFIAPSATGMRQADHPLPTQSRLSR